MNRMDSLEKRFEEFQNTFKIMDEAGRLLIRTLHEKSHSAINPGSYVYIFPRRSIVERQYNRRTRDFTGIQDDFFD